jgi:uncharacterized protein (DUF3084 family)
MLILILSDNVCIILDCSSKQVQLELCQWKTEVDQLTEETSGFQSERQLLIQTLDQVKTEHENLKLENLNLNNKNLQLLSHKEGKQLILSIPLA